MQNRRRARLRRMRRMKLICAAAAALIITVAVILIIALSSAKPVLTLNYAEEQIEVFSNYTKANVSASAKVLWFNVDVDVSTVGEVNTNKVGEYELKHTAVFSKNSVTKTQKIKVVDTTPPEIKVEEENAVVNFESYPINIEDIKVNFTATDNYDGDLTAKVQKSIVNDNQYFLSVKDSSGNEATKEINLIFDDGERPTLLLSGPTTVYFAEGSKYAEPGYSALDKLDGDITDKVEISGDVDFNKSGTYFIQYKVSDSNGYVTKISRKVVVYGGKTSDNYDDVEPNGKVVYLTFDDGPGVYTDRLLGYLDQYNVKATFFVTNQFSKYQNLIGKAYKKGHKIAVHTYSHQMYTANNNIYSSVDAYMQDFNKMQDVIEAQTGTTTNIFRFPGGTNNTISKSLCPGIMTTLAKQMTDAGYFYFDWNVDSYDSRSSSNTQKIIDETISQIKNKKNAVVLMHDIHKKTVDAVPAIIEYCLENGYTFKVLDENAPAVRNKPQN